MTGFLPVRSTIVEGRRLAGVLPVTKRSTLGKVSLTVSELVAGESPRGLAEVRSSGPESGRSVEKSDDLGMRMPIVEKWLKYG